MTRAKARLRKQTSRSINTECQVPSPAADAAPLVVALCRGVGGTTTAVRGLVRGSCLRAASVAEPLGWADEALSAVHDAGSRVVALGGADPRPDLRTVSDAIDALTHVIEFAAMAVEELVSGARAGAEGPLSHVAAADAKLTEYVRSVPLDEFNSFALAMWGREAGPVRLR
jgi:hypothetical protein